HRTTTSAAGGGQGGLEAVSAGVGPGQTHLADHRTRRLHPPGGDPGLLLRLRDPAGREGLRRPGLLPARPLARRQAQVSTHRLPALRRRGAQLHRRTLRLDRDLHRADQHPAALSALVAAGTDRPARRHGRTRPRRPAGSPDQCGGPMSSQASANALAERVRANVAELMAEFDTLSRAAHGQAGEVLTFSRRLDDYVMRFGSMRRTRVAGHILAGMRADDHRGLTALGHACAALELFHASALIHDDIIDDSPVRRNHPAFHIGWDEVAETTTVTPTAGAAPPSEPSSVVSLPL